MKPVLPSVVLLALCFCAASFVSCSKDDEALPPKEQLLTGEWKIHTIQQKAYIGSALIKDTIFKRNPRPVNIARFGDNGGSFEFKYNNSSSETGSYTWKGADSLICDVGTKIYRWKMLTLVRELLTTTSKTNSDPAYPGATVYTYYTFIK